MTVTPIDGGGKDSLTKSSGTSAASTRRRRIFTALTGSKPSLDAKCRIAVEEPHLHIYGPSNTKLPVLASMASSNSLTTSPVPDTRRPSRDHSASPTNVAPERRSSLPSTPPPLRSTVSSAQLRDDEAADDTPRYSLHLSSVVLIKEGSQMAEGGALSLRRASRDAEVLIGFTSSTYPNEHFLLRFRTADDRALWWRRLQEEHSLWHNVKEQRKQTRAAILQADIQGSWDDVPSDAFQGALRKSDLSKARMGDKSPRSASSQSLLSPRLAALARPGRADLSRSTPAAFNRKRADEDDHPREPAKPAPRKGSDASSSPSTYHTTDRRNMVVELSDDEDDDSSSAVDEELVRPVAGAPKFRAMLAFDDAPGLASASLYDMADTSSTAGSTTPYGDAPYGEAAGASLSPIAMMYVNADGSAESASSAYEVTPMGAEPAQNVMLKYVKQPSTMFLGRTSTSDRPPISLGPQLSESDDEELEGSTTRLTKSDSLVRFWRRES